MRQRILTQIEKEILTQFIASGDRLEPGYRVLRSRIKRNYKELVEDFELINKAIKKWGTK